MTWSAVFALISFPSTGLTEPNTSAITGGDQITVLNALHDMYDGSSTMSVLLEDAVQHSTAIHIAQSSQEPGLTSHTAGYVAVELAPNNYFMNEQGKMVASTMALNLAHELKHLLSTGQGLAMSPPDRGGDDLAPRLSRSRGSSGVKLETG